MVRPARRTLRGALRGARALGPLLLAIACAETTDFFGDVVPGNGGGSGMGGSFASGSGGLGGSSGATGGSDPAGGAAPMGTGGTAVAGSSAAGATAGGSGGGSGSGGTGEGAVGNEPGTGGTKGNSGGEAGEAGSGFVSGAGGEAGEAGSSGEGGTSGQGGTSGLGGAGSGAGGTAGVSGDGTGGGGMSGGGAGGGGAGSGGTSGGGLGGGGAGGGGTGGSGGCASNPERCDGVDNNCQGGADEGSVCPTGCTAMTQLARVYVLCYRSNTDITWPVAAETCAGTLSEAAGVRLELARIESPEENAALVQWIQSRNLQAGIWMGANDLDVNDTWAWGRGDSRLVFFQDDSSGGHAVDGRYNNWGSGRPNGDTMMEDCGFFEASNAWRWSDRRCELQPLPGYLCEQAE